MNQQTEMPAALVHPPGYFDPSNSAARDAHWKATLAAHDAAAPAAIAQPGPASAPAVEPNAADLETLSLTAQHKLADGKPAILSNMKFRATVERLRADVFAGNPLDRAAAQAEINAALGLTAPAAPKVQESAEPAGSPEDRAFAATAERLDAGEVVPLSEVPEDFLCGYRVELPDGWGLTGESAALLRTARAAGIPQSMVNKFIAARIEQESEE